MNFLVLGFIEATATQDLRRPSRRYGALGRILGFCAVAAFIATLTTQFGWMNRLEIVACDLATYSKTGSASGQTVILGVDAETIKATGKFRYDRRLTGLS